MSLARTRHPLWSAGFPRALVESVGLGAALLAIILASDVDAAPVVVSRSVAFCAVVAGIAAALRHRLPERSWLGRDLGFGLALAVSTPAVAYAVASALGLGPRVAGAYVGSFIAALILAQAGSVYVVARLLSRIWLAWDRLRRGHLIWALTHAHLVVVVVAVLGLAALIGLASAGNLLTTLTSASTSSPLDSILSVTVDFAFPALATLVLLVGVSVATVLPPAALVSYFVARRATGRLEALARATGELRAGHYGVRVPVSGEDEVAQLQGNFNAMAADLERTLGELEAERNRVAGLLQERRELVAAVSHELRTPVATLRGYLESVLETSEASLSPELRLDLAVMDRETERLSTLIEDLFALSRVEAGKLALRPAPTDVGALVRQSVETAAPLAWRTGRVQVVAEVPPGLPQVTVDPDRLAQVLTNLLRNAVRHTPPGGIVAVVARADEASVVLEVRDTGEGISPEDLPRVFERFYRGAGRGDGRGARRAGDGAGLGLALVRELAEAMGGSAAVQSEPGVGSTFTVRLPLA